MSCEDCGRQYGEEHGFPDFIIPYWAWKEISTTGDDGGLLCACCMIKRLHDKGIRCEGAFVSSVINSVSEHAMALDRRIENIELAIAGRDNRWGVLLRGGPDMHGPEEELRAWRNGRREELKAPDIAGSTPAARTTEPNVPIEEGDKQ